MDYPGIAPAAGPNQTTKTAPTTQVGSAVKTQTATSGVKSVEEPSQEAVKPLRDPRSIAFQVDGGRIITTIIDSQNHTVVEQIPDAEVVRLAAAIDRLQGFFVSAKA